MAAHDAAGDAQLAGVAVGIAYHRAVSARLADLLLGSVSPFDRGVECGKPVAVLEIAKVGLVALFLPHDAHHITVRGGDAPAIRMTPRVTIDPRHALVLGGLLARWPSVAPAAARQAHRFSDDWRLIVDLLIKVVAQCAQVEIRRWGFMWWWPLGAPLFTSRCLSWGGSR